MDPAAFAALRMNEESFATGRKNMSIPVPSSFSLPTTVSRAFDISLKNNDDNDTQRMRVDIMVQLFSDCIFMGISSRCTDDNKSDNDTSRSNDTITDTDTDTAVASKKERNGGGGGGATLGTFIKCIVEHNEATGINTYPTSILMGNRTDPSLTVYARHLLERIVGGGTGLPVSTLLLGITLLNKNKNHRHEMNEPESPVVFRTICNLALETYQEAIRNYVVGVGGTTTTTATL